MWASPRTSDGIAGIDRVFEREPGHLRLCGRIWTIDQAMHPFWLELATDAAGTRVGWRLSRSPKTKQAGAVPACFASESLKLRTVVCDPIGT
ncbi:MAG: hypothetical protein JWP01_3908 [Myxococcales bacterium]|nr:hypothetical protein [Myxococcales bacterium]